MNKRLLFSLGPLTSALLLIACSESSDRQSISESVKANESPARIAAQVGERVIALSEVDAPITLQLYDLERAQYELRAQQLAKLLQASTSKTQPEIFLNPPLPPRIELRPATVPRKGAANAPVLLSVFCSFQSPHCARVQPVFAEIEQQYGEQVAWQLFDLPQRFHRSGRPAALAARCAGEQNHYWSYQQALYPFHQNLDVERFRTVAHQLQLDATKFDDCFNKQAYRPQVEADIAYAEELGLGNVPVVFVNGLYVKGPQPLEEYQRWIDWELQRLGLQPAQTKSARAREVSLQRTQLPLRLTATTLSNDPDASTAMIKIEAAEAKPFKIWQQLLPGVVLVAVEEHQVLMDNKGKLEFLPLQADPNANRPDTQSAGSSAGSTASPPTATTQAVGDSDERRIIAPTGQIPLKREWVENQLEDKSELEKRFNQAEHVVEGHHLLKLKDVAGSEFYSTLGLEEGDVVLRVNDEWLHSEQNPLWQALQQQQEVSVVLIRRGLPVHYQYSIE